MHSAQDTDSGAHKISHGVKRLSRQSQVIVLSVRPCRPGPRPERLL
jgi:hypothetical protein